MTELTDISYNVWAFMSILSTHEALVDDCLEIYPSLYSEHSEAIQWAINEEWMTVEYFNDHSQTMYARISLQGMWFMHLAKYEKFLEHLWQQD